jgi:hypothetical protein
MSIDDFIKKHNLEHVIEKAVEIVKNYFPDAEIQFYLYQDHEIEDLQTLIIGINMTNYSEDFFEKVSEAYHKLLDDVGWGYADYIDIDIKFWA